VPLTDGLRSPAFKLFLAIVVALALTIPLFSVWLLVYDRQTQSQEATASITEGWGGPQAMTGPVLVIPYAATATETVLQNGQSVTRSNEVMRELRLAPEIVQVSTAIRPELRKRSIYEAVVYDADVTGQARFALPADLASSGVQPGQMDLARAELRFGLSDPRGLGANPKVMVAGRPLRLQPGSGSGGGRGFFAWVDATDLALAPIAVDFAYDFRGNSSLTLAPDAGDTRWSVRSSWPHPSFTGEFLPSRRSVGDRGFEATYRIGNLALGRSLVSTGDRGAASPLERVGPPDRAAAPASTDATGAGGPVQTASVSLIQPVDLYSQVNRATKYGFLFIGFTAAYVVASAAIAGLNTAYSAAVLGSWRRAGFIGGLLVGLYAVLYILLSLEAYSLLIGSLLLFGALAGVMYATRRIDWGAPRAEEVA
jgi:inner membrane protein